MRTISFLVYRLKEDLETGPAEFRHTINKGTALTAKQWEVQHNLYVALNRHLFTIEQITKEVER